MARAFDMRQDWTESLAAHGLSEAPQREVAHTYRRFGLRLRSAIELPDLPEEDGQPPCLDTVDIGFAQIAVDLVVPRDGMLVRPMANGDILLAKEDVGKFLVREGREIVIDPVAGAPQQLVVFHLLGSILGALLHQRGFLVLHASAVAVAGHALVFVGESGAGKSTLAAYFQRRGWTVLCDDICAITFDDAMRPLVWPGCRRIKLWRNTLEKFGQDTTSLQHVMDGMDKFHVPMIEEDADSPLPLHCVYVLDRGPEGGRGHIERLSGRDAMIALMTNIYRGEIPAATGSLPKAFSLSSAVARHAPVYRAYRIWGFDAFEAEAEALLQHGA